MPWRLICAGADDADDEDDPVPAEPLSASDGTEVVGDAGAIDSVVCTGLPSNMYPCGSGPSF